MQHQHWRNFSRSIKAMRNCQVETCGHCIGKVVQRQRSFLAVHTLRMVAPVTRPELLKHQIRPFRLRITGQTVDSPIFADPVAYFGIVMLGLFRVTGS